MARNRIQTALTWVAVPVGLVGAFVVGLFVYVNATARPLHPDPKGVPSVTYSPAVPMWAGAMAEGRERARAGLIQQNLPGLSVAVGVGGELVWAEGLGYADLEKKAPVRPETRFKVADVSKALTSAAAGLLLEKDKLKLDRDIQSYVPEYPNKQWPVTLRQLMGQVAGVRQDQGDEEPLDERCDRTVDGLKRFADSPLRFEPGTRYSPSSYGWILVSAAIEAAAQEPFFTYMRTQIFQPLGMRDTTIDVSTEPIPDKATFYYPRFGGDTRYGPELARDGDYSCFAGAGAFLSTPSDLVRFGMAFNAGKVVKPDTVKLLQSPQQLASGEEVGYGLGWKLETVPLAGQPTRMAGHGSKADFIGASTFLMTFPERGIVVAVMTNTAFADTRSIALKLADAFAAPGTTPARK